MSGAEAATDTDRLGKVQTDLPADSGIIELEKCNVYHAQSEPGNAGNVMLYPIGDNRIFGWLRVPRDVYENKGSPTALRAKVILEPIDESEVNL